MKRWLLLLLACAALSLVVAGCGGDDDDGGGGGAQNDEQPAESGGGGGAEKESGGGAGGGTQVAMKGIKFNPASVTVSAGDTVTWTNDDTVGHDVTGDGFKSGDPGAMQNGDTFEHAFDKAGTFDYVCTVHPGMAGSVKVK
jgi:plastocyanin